MITIDSTKIKVSENIDIVGIDKGGNDTVQAVFLKAGTMYKWVEILITVTESELLDYLTDDYNFCTQRESGEYYSLVDALMGYYCDNNFYGG